MNTKRFAALILAAALVVISISGCTLGEKTRIAATYNGGEIPAGVYISYQLTAVNEAYYKVADPTADVMKQEIEGVKASEWVSNRAAELTRNFVAVESEFIRLGLTLDSGMTAAATSGLRQSWEGEKDRMQKIGIGYSSVEALALNSVKSQQVFQAYYGEGGEFAVTEADYQKFFEDNYRQVMMLVLSKKYDQVTQTPYDEAGAAEQQKVIQSYFDRAKAGESLFALIVEQDEALHAVMDSGNAHTHAPLTEQSETSLVYRENTNFPEALREKMFASSTINVIETYEDENYGIVFERRDLMADPMVYASTKPSLLGQMKQEEFNQKLLAVSDSVGFAFNQDAIKSFKIDTLLG